MKRDSLLNDVVNELISKHKCHAVLLYGSHARGDATEHSDYDLMGVRKSGRKFRIARKQDGTYIDIFVFPESDLKKVDESFLYMHGAKVVFDKNGFGAAFIRKLGATKKKKYKPLSENEIEVRRVWLHKMYERTLVSDIEGNYRRSWLHEALLIEYFNLRKKRYLGSKQSFGWLKKNDPTTYRLFEKTLASPLESGSLKKLVDRVSGVKL
jgi:predicted nucleotidyltransferase